MNDAANKNVEWLLTPGTVAHHFSETSLQGFNGAEGILVAEGTTALILVNGKAEHLVGPGAYRFQPPPQFRTAQGMDSLMGFLAGIFGGRSKAIGAESATEGTAIFYPKKVSTLSVWLLRASAFPVHLELIPNRGGDPIGVDVTVQVQEPLLFLQTLLVDQSVKNTIDVGQALAKRLGDRGYHALVNSIASGPAEAEKVLQKEWSAMLGETGIKIVNLLGFSSESQKATADRRKELNETREQLDVLTDLWKARNSLGRGQMLAEDERNGIRHEVEKIGLLRASEMEQFKTGLSMEHEKSHNQMEAQSLLLKDAIDKLQNRLRSENATAEIDVQEKLDTRKARLEIEIKKIRDFGDFEIRAKIAREQIQLENETETARMDRKRTERDDKLKAMEKLAEIRGKVDSSRAARQREEVQSYAGMSPEQIMAINPNLTEAAALALSEKYKASGKDEAWKMVAEMTQKNAEEMRKFLESQAKTQADIVKGAISNVRGEDSRAEKRTKARVDQVAKLAQKVRNPDPRRDKTEDRSSSKEFTDSEEADTSGDEENEDS